MVEFDPPGEDGLTQCPAHPGRRFHPVRESCTGCDALPKGEPDDLDADKYAEHAEAAQAAAEAGLPNALGYEAAAIAIRDEAEQESTVNRRLAAVCEARGLALLQGEVEVSVPVVIEGAVHMRDATTTEVEREAREWIRTAAAFRGNIRALIGERGKVNKAALAAAAIRDSDAKLDERQRNKAKRRSAN